MPVTTSITPTYDSLSVPTLNWTGPWSAATAYNPGDTVFSAGSSYVAVNASTNDPPPSANWNLLAQQGATGATGATGPQGPVGAAGTPGSVWYTGTGAPPGATGVVGDYYLDTSNGNYYNKTGASTWTLRGNLTGPQGATGAQGPIGNTGPQGATGATGPQGATGAQGATGPQGAPGSVWYEGTTPPAAGLGINGDFYLNFSTGDVYQKSGGAWVLQGNITGPRGPTGNTGATGPQGPTGATGPQGATGATGPQGATGAQGAPGPVVTWRGTWSVSNAYAQWDAVGYLGSSYLATGAIAPGLAPPTSPWALMAQAGATGATGPQGATGPTGATGATGPQGPQGVQGPPGATGPIGPAGVAGAAGPQGIQGNPGPTGAQGAAGAAGPTGPTGPAGAQGPLGPAGPQGPAGLGLNILGTVPSYSQLPPQPQPANNAYTAVDTGHLWTSNGTQWVDTGLLRGPAGPVGPQGAAGPAGAAGAVGPTGPTGPQGPIGATGAQGPMGAQGPPGDPYSVPALAIGVVVHWRPAENTYDRYGLCKPAVVTEVISLSGNLINAVVLGSSGGPVLLYDQIPTGTSPGRWHFIANCPYSMGPASAQAIAFVHTNGVAV